MDAHTGPADALDRLEPFDAVDDRGRDVRTTDHHEGRNGAGLGGREHRPVGALPGWGPGHPDRQAARAHGLQGAQVTDLDQDPVQVIRTGDPRLDTRARLRGSSPSRAMTEKIRLCP